MGRGLPAPQDDLADSLVTNLLFIQLIKEVAWRWAASSYLLFSGTLPLGPSNIWQHQRWEGPFSFFTSEAVQVLGVLP